MSRLVKICGLKNAADAEVAASAGADLLGFIHFKKSPRHLSIEMARALAPNLPNNAVKGSAAEPKRVAVMVDPDDETLLAYTSALRATHVQLHGSESPERVAAVRAVTGLDVIKVIKVAQAEDVESAQRYEDIVDMLLFDTKPLAGDILPGGNARRFPWHLMQGLRVRVPTLVAGGLTPETVQEALISSGATGADVSSGTESAPGVKSHALIRGFLGNTKAVS